MMIGIARVRSSARRRRANSMPDAPAAIQSSRYQVGQGLAHDALGGLGIRMRAPTSVAGRRR